MGGRGYKNKSQVREEIKKIDIGLSDGGRVIGFDSNCLGVG